MSTQKYQEELAYWVDMYKKENNVFNNDHYKRIMLAIAEEQTDDFVSGKRIADFGCGPRGSLVWAEKASLRVGIDVLVHAYADLFHDNINSHGMVYVQSTEKHIPIPSNYFDIVFTTNALDHVYDLGRMSDEIRRIIKPGGELIASFNLEEPASVCEPQRLTEDIIEKDILKGYCVRSKRTAARGDGKGKSVYYKMYEGDYQYQKGTVGLFWVRATKE